MKWRKCDAAFPQILGRGERDSSRMAAINLGVLAGVLLCAREEGGGGRGTRNGYITKAFYLGSTMLSALHLHLYVFRLYSEEMEEQQ